MKKRAYYILLVMAGCFFLSAAWHDSGLANAADKAVPRYDESTVKNIYVITMATGKVVLIDKIDDSPEQIRSADMKQNAFSAMGRTSARPGDIMVKEIRKEKGSVDTILLMDTVNGTLSYLTGLGDNPDKGEVKAVSEKPTQAIASNDANYSMFLRYAPKGETIGAYLCHLTDGKCLYFNEIQKMHKKYAPDATNNVCAIMNISSTLEIHAGIEGPRFHLLVDHVTGELYWIEVDQKNPKKLYCRKEHKLKLLDVFPEKSEIMAPYRFVMIPVLIDNDSTWHVFIIDVGTGAMALYNVHDYKNTELKRVEENLYKYLPKDTVGSRFFTAVPQILKGFTKGAWLFDSATGNVLFLDRIDDVHDFKIRAVTIEKK